ncbi:MAG: hypothetical protein WC821_04325 [archaeon]|jgi:hypothetical protein
MPVLIGGRKNVRVTRISRGKILGGASEGLVRKVRVTLKRGKIKKKLRLAEKAFYPLGTSPAHYSQPNLRNPEGQYNTMRKIQELNRKLKLKLPILPTIRLLTLRNGEKRLVVTLLKNVLETRDWFGKTQLFTTKKSVQKIPLSDGKTQVMKGTHYKLVQLTIEQKDAIQKEKRRTLQALQKLGFNIENEDAWMYTQDPKTKEIKVWLGDFGNVVDTTLVED